MNSVRSCFSRTGLTCRPWPRLRRRGRRRGSRSAVGRSPGPCLDDEVNRHPVLDAVPGKRLVVLHDLAREDQAELLHRGGELARDLLLELWKMKKR